MQGQILDFKQLAEQALAAATEGATFNIADAESKVSTTGNVGFRVKLSNGKTVHFWSSNVDQVVEAMDDNGNYRVVPGTRVADDGGLIAKDAKQGGFWQ